MTFTQLKVAVLTAQLGSVSAAAKSLNISQSNASSYLNTIEKECGYPIIKRSRSGVQITDKGKEFLEHAKKILAESDLLSRISEESPLFRLRIGSMNFSKAMDILIKTYQSFCDDYSLKCDIRYHNVSLENGIEMLEEYSIDLLVAFLREKSLSTADWLSERNDLLRIPIAKVPLCIRLRKGHPLLKNEAFVKGELHYSLFQDYPMVDYPSFRSQSNIPSLDDFDFYSYCMMADGKENRLKLIANTNAFTFGIELSEEEKEKYGLVSVQLPNFYCELNLFLRRSDSENREILRYIEIIKEEMKQK